MAFVFLLLFSAAVGLYYVHGIYVGLEDARQAMLRRDWPEAEKVLIRYLSQHPHDSAARFLLAEVLVNEDKEDSQDAVVRAVEHLQKIKESDPLFAEARLQQARLALLIFRQPGRAERLLRESLAADPDSYDANLLMWKVLDLTGRHDISREFFWRVYEQSPKSQRPLRLRDWFASEFFPDTANRPFYQVLGVEKVGSTPASVALLINFLESEPEATCLNAALARYYLGQGDHNSALQVLRQAPDLDKAMDDPFFVAALFETLVDLGEFGKARKCFERYPLPHSGYVYWRCEGMFRQHLLEDPAAAEQSYARALETWPGKFDWGVMMRRAECLRACGRVDEVQELQVRIKYLTTKVLTRERTDRLRQRLGRLDDPDVAREVRDLYREFSLTKEANEWEALREELLEEL